MGCSASNSIDEGPKRNGSVENNGNNGNNKSNVDKSSQPPDSPRTAKAKRTKDSFVTHKKGGSNKGKSSNSNTMNNDEYTCVSTDDFEKMKEDCSNNGIPLFAYCGTEQCGNCTYFFDEFKESMLANGFSWTKINLMESFEASFEDCPQGQSLMMPIIKCYNNGQFIGATFGGDSEEFKDLISKLDSSKMTVKKPKMQKKKLFLKFQV